MYRNILERNKHRFGGDTVNYLMYSESRLLELLILLHRKKNFYTLSTFSLQTFLKNLSSKNEHVDKEHSLLFLRDLNLCKYMKKQNKFNK